MFAFYHERMNDKKIKKEEMNERVKEKEKEIFFFWTNQNKLPSDRCQ